MKKLLSLIIVISFVFLCVSLASAADIPMILNYQGYVEDAGVPVEGDGYFKFVIVDPNGITHWSNDGTSTTGDKPPDNAVMIPVSNGFFTIKLGDTEAGVTNMSSPLEDSVFTPQNIFVRVWFSTDNMTFEQLSPDTQIVSTGFAYKAQTVVDNAVTTAIIRDGTITNADISNAAKINASKINPIGLDADTLDGYNSSDFAAAEHPHINYAEVTHSHSASDITSDTLSNDRLDTDLQDLAVDGVLSGTKVQHGEYFINSAGTSGQVWKSDGDGPGGWGTDNSFSVSEPTVENYIANDVSTNYVPRDNGTKLVSGTIYDNGTKVGIGTTNPLSSLSVGGGGSIAYAIYATGANYAVRGEGGGVGIYGIGTYGGYFIGKGYFSGNVGIGTASPAVKLHVAQDGTLLNNGEDGTIRIGSHPSWYGEIKYEYGPGDLTIQSGTTSTASGADIIFKTKGVDRAIINGYGNVGIGTTSPTHLLHVNGLARSTQSTWATSSDERVKKNIADLTDSLKNLMKLRPVSFEYTDKYKQGNEALEGKQIGFVAQEVKEVMPNMVTTTSETFGDTTIDDFHLLNTSNLVPILVQSVKELKAKNEAQETLIEELMVRISALEAAIQP